MDDYVTLEVAIPEDGFDAVVLELQKIQTQNETLVAEIQSVRNHNSELCSDVGLLTMLVVVLVLYKVRDVVLSFVKKGGVKQDV